MSFLTFLDKALDQLAMHPADAHTAEITRSALRMKALYAELDARATAGDRSAGATPSDLPLVHRLGRVEGGAHSLDERNAEIPRTLAGGSGLLARSQVDAQDSTLKAGLGEAGGRLSAAPNLEVVKTHQQPDL